MFGFFNILKPPGPTSHDVVDQLRRLLGRSAKIGHAGTLDPFAEGVLVICAGQATRLADYVQQQPKRYVAEIVLGATSTTDDPEGTIEPTEPAAPPTSEAVRKALQTFVGDIQQVPPAHSAVHVDGRRAYDLAREGRQVDLQPRTVRVDSIDLLRLEGEVLEIDVACGSGTYIRALARDIGRALGIGGYCRRLTRTAVGAFTLEGAVRPKELDPASHLLSPLLAVAHLPCIVVDEAALRLLEHGMTVDLNAHAQPAPDASLLGSGPAGQAALVNQRKELLAVAEIADAHAYPRKVFVR